MPVHGVCHLMSSFNVMYYVGLCSTDHMLSVCEQRQCVLGFVVQADAFSSLVILLQYTLCKSHESWMNCTNICCTQRYYSESCLTVVIFTNCIQKTTFELKYNYSISLNPQQGKRIQFEIIIIVINNSSLNRLRLPFDEINFPSTYQ